jgi:hypothetical protein
VEDVGGAGDSGRVQTHQQPSSGPGEQTRALTAWLADLCRRDAARFARVVRHHDQLVAAGVAEPDAWRVALGDEP